MEIVKSINNFKRAVSSFNRKPSTLIHHHSPHELQTIFRRLDSNRDGELDMEEYQRVVKLLKLGDDEIAITKSFENADKDNSGKLSMKDFERAYEILYQNVVRNSPSNSDAGKYICIVLKYGRV